MQKCDCEYESGIIIYAPEGTCLYDRIKQIEFFKIKCKILSRILNYISSKCYLFPKLYIRCLLAHCRLIDKKYILQQGHG